MIITILTEILKVVSAVNTLVLFFAPAVLVVLVLVLQATQVADRMLKVQGQVRRGRSTTNAHFVKL